MFRCSRRRHILAELRGLRRMFYVLDERLINMAVELDNLKAAAAAIIAKLNELAASQGVPPAEVQAVTDQLNAAVAAATPPTV